MTGSAAFFPDRERMVADEGSRLADRGSDERLAAGSVRGRDGRCAPGRGELPAGTVDAVASGCGARRGDTDADGRGLRRDSADVVPTAAIPSGSDLIAAERQRQLDSEGWSPEHDDEHDQGELAAAAAVYAMPDLYDEWWPWDESWYRPGTPIRELTKAGALIAAEIDRRLRAGEQP